MNANREDILRRSVAVIIFALLLAFPAASVLATDEAEGYQLAVSELIDLLDSRPDLQASLAGAVSRADLKDIGDIPAFLQYIDGLVTLVPTERDLRYAWFELPQERLDEQAQKMRESVRQALMRWALDCGEAADSVVPL